MSIETIGRIRLAFLVDHKPIRQIVRELRLSLPMRAVFGLALLRQTEGFIGSVIDLLGLALPVPDHLSAPW